MAKYPLIKTTLKDRLLGGHYPEGLPLPSEPQLAREFEVSRMTARRAIDELEREGYVYRVQGAGTFPTGKRFRQGMFRVRPFKEWARHPDHRTTVLRAMEIQATPEIGIVLQVQPGDPVAFVHRLRTAGDEPLVIEKRYINTQLAPDLLGHNLAAESIHEVMVSMGVVLTRVEQTLEAVNLRQEEADLLRVPVGTASFLLRRTTYSGTKRVSYVNYWVRGDRYAFQDSFEP
ncbi:GntR family transcriptional regulator [Deinococcus maricopensis]|uniref:Transcriptional regulator, GntR family with UTRA sensor domain protein n=1 Tax=Deinococcus maricopensis (strain DSM 21211 / LMG 22137 / NRRL B-23946 / LB-34) TaxID=709986 RepID=E8UBI7_DEIML|nr:GntR family transcriptional regulator [Deinococcus maricopensis]ADV68426.1 transcriptional regulator, GntR family with UTRA sensor domain protein [Deinococcus maricopensis DSM 21211]